MKFTVLTPTYNRAHTLARVYESLNRQTYPDFEWVIVDDGSTDSTRDLVASWKASYPIRYFWKPNGGKHTAMNAGVTQARGEFVLFFDSDDSCMPNALERFDYHWRQIPNPERFSTLSCLCSTPSGSIVGERYPGSYVDAHSLAEQLRYRSAERWGINRTDVLREFPFPEGERFVPEALVWNRISRKYAARFVNEALRTYEPGADSLSVKMFEIRANSPKATLTYYRELALSPVPISLRARAALNFLRFAGVTAMRKLRRPAQLA